MATVTVKVSIPQALAGRSELRPISRTSSFFHYCRQNAAKVGVLTVALSVAHETVSSQRWPIAAMYTACALVGVFALVDVLRWERSARSSRPYEYLAELDDDGVTITWPQRVDRMPWSSYTGYHELEDSLEIWLKDGGCSYLPKGPETEAAIAFTKARLKPFKPVTCRPIEP